MRDYRGKRMDTGEWVYGYLALPNPKVCRVYEVNDAAIGYQTSAKTGYLFHAVLPETVGQYTGVNAAILWEELTEAQKKAFYDSVKSEDGVTIKYDKIEAVKHLWKALPIYEGDIVEAVLMDGIHRGFSWGRHVVVFDQGAFCLKDRRGQITPMCNYSANVKFKVLGNIWDNPEIMEGSADA